MSPVKPAGTFHEVRERRRRGAVSRIERWRAREGRLYEKTTAPDGAAIVRAVAEGRGFEIRGNDVRKLRPAEIRQWRREVRMVPANFEAHMEDMGVTRSADGRLERFEAPQDRLVLERDARSGVPRRVIDLRSKKSIVFEQPKDAQGRHWPRMEIFYSLDRELWRDRILSVEFDRPVPAEVTRLWEALSRGPA